MDASIPKERLDTGNISTIILQRSSTESVKHHSYKSRPKSQGAVSESRGPSGEAVNTNEAW